METGIEHDHVMAVLQGALKRPPEEREAYLRSACEGDECLYRQVAESLDWEERMGSFLKEPLLDFTALARPFEPGQVLLERFEILREIGEGGMGVVYEAFDRRLQQPIAIKAAKPGFQRLLTPELRAALRVRHHNICLVKEIHTAQTEYGEVDFLAMELLEGETLSAYLKKAGKLPHGEALDLACQICAGLAEAHHSGIIHRDLKGGNIFLCKNEDGSRRAVITDFGLAGGPIASGEVAGTPAYMAPELWRGEPPSCASDIYALGVIFYELVAGCRPYEREDEVKFGKLATLTFHGSTAEDSRPDRRSILDPPEQWPKRDAPPEPPSSWVRGLDPRWDRVTMRCLEIAPADRPQDAAEILADLKREPINKTPFAVAALVLAVIVAVVGLVRPLRLAVLDFIWPPNVRLAVLPYDGPKEFDKLAGGALQDAAERVQQLPSTRKWPLSKLSRTVAVISPSQLASMGITTPDEARKQLGASQALKLTLRNENGKVDAEASIIDLASLLTTKQLAMQYTTSDASAMSTALTHFLAMTFRLREPASEDKLSAAARPAYLNGIYYINRDIQSFDEAITQFQQAAQLDPNSALPPSGMALALVQKYINTRQPIYLQQAQQFVRGAQSRNPDSTQVLLAAGYVSEVGHQWNKALQYYRRVEELDPRNVDVQQRLGRVYEGLEEREEALAAFRKAQELDPEYYRSYQMMAQFYLGQGRYQEAAEQYQKTVALAPGSYDGYAKLGGVLAELGRFPEAEDALRKSLAIRETPQALNNLGGVLNSQGRYEEAAASQKKALAYRPKGALLLLLLTNIADNLRLAGHKSEPVAFYGRARDEAQAELDAESNAADVRGTFAYICARLHDRIRAEHEIKQALNSAPDDSDVLRSAVLTYETLGQRGLAIEASRSMSLAQLKQLTHEPDLADFCRDPRFIQQMIDKGGQ